MPYKDKEDQRRYRKIYNPIHYAKNKERLIAQVRARSKEIDRFVQSLKDGKKCVVCGERDPVCLDFHHRDPATKQGVLAWAGRNGWGKKKILDEVEKCDIICSNCHRKLHRDLSMSANG